MPAAVKRSPGATAMKSMSVVAAPSSAYTGSPRSARWRTSIWSPCSWVTSTASQPSRAPGSLQQPGSMTSTLSSMFIRTHECVNFVISTCRSLDSQAVHLRCACFLGIDRLALLATQPVHAADRHHGGDRSEKQAVGDRCDQGSAHGYRYGLRPSACQRQRSVDPAHQLWSGAALNESDRRYVAPDDARSEHHASGHDYGQRAGHHQQTARADQQDGGADGAHLTDPLHHSCDENPSHDGTGRLDSFEDAEKCRRPM